MGYLWRSVSKNWVRFTCKSQYQNSRINDSERCCGAAEWNVPVFEGIGEVGGQQSAKIFRLVMRHTTYRCVQSAENVNGLSNLYYIATLGDYTILITMTLLASLSDWRLKPLRTSNYYVWRVIHFQSLELAAGFWEICYFFCLASRVERVSDSVLYTTSF